MKYLPSTRPFYIFFLLLTFLELHSNNPIHQIDPDWANCTYYNTHTLKNNITLIEQGLLQDGFHPIQFESEDGYTIDGLYLEKPKAQFTVIAISGCSGEKERAAPLFAMLANEPCNILIYTQRNPGWKKTYLQFTRYRHKDVIGAINYAHQQSCAPIFLWGSCASAYHCTRALIALEQKGLIKALNIHGLIFDSGWSSPIKVTQTVPQGWCKEGIARAFKGAEKDYKKTAYKPFIRKLSNIVCQAYCLFHSLIIKPALIYSKNNANLIHKINLITIPILFIHSYDDWQTPIKDAQALAHKAPKSEHWWIKKRSKHAMHHFKHKVIYQKVLKSFFARHI